MDSINDVITGLFDELMPSAKSALVIPAQIIATVAIVFQVFSGLSNPTTMENFSRNWIKNVLPIIVVAFLVFNYGTLFEYIYQVFKQVDVSTMNLSDDTSQQLSDLRDQKAAIASQQRDNNTSLLDGLSDNLGFSFIIDKIDEGFESILHTVIELIYLAIYLVYKLLSFLSIYFLCVFGPVQVALYFTTWYNGSFASWIARLVTSLMWMPILNIVKMVVEKMQVYFIKIDIAQMQSGSGVTAGQDDWLEYVALVVGIFMFSQVPNFASFILESSGIGGENGAFRTIIGSSASAAGGAVGTVAGGLKGAVGNAGGKAVTTIKNVFS
jgi:hypothetical protein